MRRPRPAQWQAPGHPWFASCQLHPDQVRDTEMPGSRPSVGPANIPLEFQITWKPEVGPWTVRDQLHPLSTAFELLKLPNSSGPAPTVFAPGVPTHHIPRSGAQLAWASPGLRLAHTGACLSFGPYFESLAADEGRERERLYIRNDGWRVEPVDGFLSWFPRAQLTVRTTLLDRLSVLYEEQLLLARVFREYIGCSFEGLDPLVFVESILVVNGPISRFICLGDTHRRNAAICVIRSSHNHSLQGLYLGLELRFARIATPLFVQVIFQEVNCLFRNPVRAALGECPTQKQGSRY